MRRLPIAISTLALVATLAPAPAGAQQSGNGRPSAALHVSEAYRSCFFDLQPGLTQSEFDAFTAELGSVLRFRQLGDSTTLRRGRIEVGVQFADTSIDNSKGACNTTSQPAAAQIGRSFSYPQVAARFGVSDRVDIGAWGGYEPGANYGLVGVDTKIAVLRQGPSRPVSVSIRPSFATLIRPSKVWVGSASVDLSVSRAFGPVSPYAGVATSTWLAVERLGDGHLDPATADHSLAYAGLSYRWRALIVSGEVENGTRVSYAFRIGTRF